MSHEQVDAFMSLPVGAYVDCFKIDLGESVKATKDSMVPSEYDLVRIGDRDGIEVCVRIGFEGLDTAGILARIGIERFLAVGRLGAKFNFNLAKKSERLR